MSTITLYGSKISRMPVLIREAKSSVTDYKSELSSLKTKSLNINKSVCDIDNVISSIQSSSQTQEDKANSLEISKKTARNLSMMLLALMEMWQILSTRTKKISMRNTPT